MMKLVKIDGNIWELSCLQREYSRTNRNIPVEEANNRVIDGSDISDVTRVLSGYGVRSEATATIETIVHGLPHQMQYVIYLNSKGFYCKVQNQRIFLKDIKEQTK